MTRPEFDPETGDVADDDYQPAEPGLEVDEEARRLQDGSDKPGPGGASEAERVAQRPDF
jgi:hypothetical protein